MFILFAQATRDCSFFTEHDPVVAVLSIPLMIFVVVYSYVMIMNDWDDYKKDRHYREKRRRLRERRLRERAAARKPK